MATPSVLYPKKIDLTNCDKEPIHLLGKIQPHGMLFVIEKGTLNLLRVSENVFGFFSRKREEINTLHLYDFLSNENTKLVTTHINSGNQQVFEIVINGDIYVVIPHTKDDLIYLEIENVTGKAEVHKAQQQLSEIISSLSNASSTEAMCDTATDLIKDFLEYDRVMVYQFDQNWNGRVVAESQEDHLESWLGLHYPATDIPQQARASFLKQGVRIISNVAATPVPIYPLLNDDNEPLDLSRCETRAVSPIHIEYLENMGVGATLTAAIVCNGTLWGLIACHHYSPKFINYYHRHSIKFLTQVFSTQLTLRSSNEVLKRINTSSLSRSILVAQMTDGWDVHKGLTGATTTMLDITEATGGAVFLDNALSVTGDTPSQDEIKELIDWVFDQQKGSVFTTHNLSQHFEKGAAYAKIASGVFCHFMTPNKKDCLLYFKPEVRETISWGGNPEKAVDQRKQGLSPRKSFDRWTKEQENTSRPWEDYEIASVKALVSSISGIIISKYSEVKELNDKLNEAYKELESFSYSVSHDLRAPLRGIDGFAQIIKEDYYDSLDAYGKSAIETILKSTHKMNDLIDDILAFSGLGKKGAAMGVFSINGLVLESLDFLQVTTLYPTVKLEIQEGLPEAYGDSVMIFQLLNNLLDNAFKYSKQKADPVVKVGYLSKDNDTIYFVKDNGIGFKNEYAEKIFGVFNRLVKDEFEGSGIGLAIAKRVIDKHKGRIWAESEPDNGTTFYFKLPQK